MAAGPGLYSRVVAVLKVGLPLIALALLAGLFLAPREEERGVVFSPGDVEAFGEGLRISNPTFTGTTRGDDRFRFTAELVVPDAAPPERAAIERPAGTNLGGEFSSRNRVGGARELIDGSCEPRRHENGDHQRNDCCHNEGDDTDCCRTLERRDVGRGCGSDGQLDRRFRETARYREPRSAVHALSTNLRVRHVSAHRHERTSA